MILSSHYFNRGTRSILDHLLPERDMSMIPSNPPRRNGGRAGGSIKSYSPSPVVWGKIDRVDIIKPCGLLGAIFDSF